MGRKKKSITQKQLEVLSGRVSYELYKQVEEIAAYYQLNLTQIVRRAVADFVAKHRRPQAGHGN